MTDYDLERAYQHCTHNQGELQASDLCGCFYCLAVFTTDEIKHLIGYRTGDSTAMCPQCGSSTVIGLASGFAATAEFLTRMRQHWFGTSEP